MGLCIAMPHYRTQSVWCPNFLFHYRQDQTRARAHGSFAGLPADAANAFGSNPDRFPRGGEALRTLEVQPLAIENAAIIRYPLATYLVKRILGIVIVRKAGCMKL